jgi:hypothetical protein
MKSPQEINGREPILSKICITANVQENVILHYKTFYLGKPNFFAIGPVVFAPGTQTYATELKKWTTGNF